MIRDEEVQFSGQNLTLGPPVAVTRPLAYARLYVGRVTGSRSLRVTLKQAIEWCSNIDAVAGHRSWRGRRHIIVQYPTTTRDTSSGRRLLKLLSRSSAQWNGNDSRNKDHVLRKNPPRLRGKGGHEITIAPCYDRMVTANSVSSV